MTNAEKALKLMVDFFEAEGIPVNNQESKEIIDKWEKKLDPINPLSLAAVAISNPTEVTLTKSEIDFLREFYFPSNKFAEGGFY